MNCEKIQAYGETFTIDERAHAVSELSAWFQLDSWTVREGLLLLVGIDPARSEDLLFSESGFETKPKPTWARITARPGLSANEVDANGWPHITGLIFNRDELMWLSRLLNLWVATPLHTMTGRHEPRYFVEWAGSKNCTPYWREWALDAKLFIDTAPVQAAATPAPVGAVGASGDVELDNAEPAKPLQRTAAQDSAILCEIEKQGYDPLALPKNPLGKPGAKAAIRAALSKNLLFTGATVFNKAWERLTDRADIVIQG